MNLLPYKEIILLAKEKIAESLAPLRAREMRKKGELAICRLESQIAEREQAIQELASQYPIDFDCILDAMDELALIARRRDEFQELLGQLFPGDN